MVATVSGEVVIVGGGLVGLEVAEYLHGKASKITVVSAYPCDSVVVAIGAKSRNYEGLQHFCIEHDIPVHVIGDALRIRRALNVVSKAHEVRE